ncbi:MAG TPA: hypothetical protein PKB04_10610, partial [Phenylobacterium sp.]|nr:hypothetical protein [Phenylobacterium sp.]
MASGIGLRRETALALWLAGGFAACALFSVTLTRDTNSIAALWLANGLLAVGALLLLDHRERRREDRAGRPDPVNVRRAGAFGAMVLA